MNRTARPALLIAAALAGCSRSAPPPPPPPPPVVEQLAPAPSPTAAAVVIPKRLRAALAQAAPREAALVAAPNADAGSIALVRLLDGNVRRALAELERDGGRHVTPEAVARASTAIKDLQNHLDEYNAHAAAIGAPP